MAGCFIPLDPMDIQQKALDAAMEKARLIAEAEAARRAASRLTGPDAPKEEPQAATPHRAATEEPHGAR